MGFSKDFLWGTATASYQIEGAWNEGGKGPSIWDDFTKEPGRVADASSGDAACDHYHRYQEDVQLMADMGVKNYRFSIAWPRILPNGTGTVNEEGIRFYSDLVDCLLSHGIRPFVTLYHWDLPRVIHYQGAWLNDSMPDWFAAYVTVVAERLGDRVKDFFTINEPQCIIGLGYDTCAHAPGVKYPIAARVRMIHNLLKCHGRAVQVLREKIPGVRVGYAPCATPAIPATDSPEDIAAAHKAYYGVSADPERMSWSLTWFSDPVVLGSYPEEGLRLYGQYLPEGWEHDMALICQPLDYYAQNIYNGMVVRAADNEAGFEQVRLPAGYAKTAFDWPITPDCLYWGPKLLWERYQLPIIITENGMSCHDTPSLDGEVHDPNRIDYIHRYLLALRRCMDEGSNIAGYFYWSFFDNFEWGSGYMERFGLTYVNYQTQQRIPKDSAKWFKHVMESNGTEL